MVRRGRCKDGAARDYSHCRDYSHSPVLKHQPRSASNLWLSSFCGRVINAHQICQRAVCAEVNIRIKIQDLLTNYFLLGKSEV